MISFSQFRQTEIQVAETGARYFLGASFDLGLPFRKFPFSSGPKRPFKCLII